ncbi:NUDIX domain-containing protein [Candidatus Saccharibacteria bacterium]|nr:NUDIX domain-containing protein [Candidatus Saccharibacteria bacterium]MDQ5953418.1 hypothetical protein [Patescibacteria group bacterium]MDQ5958325.1 hypothetical protein [Patescibacteria group bacterium]
MLKNYPKQYMASKNSPYHITSGAVVYRISNKNIEFLLLVRKEQCGNTYHLPKGTVFLGESLEDAAKREVLEETGALVDLQTYIGAVTKQFNYKDCNYDKTSHYFVAKFVKFVAKHDSEHDDIIWANANKAIELLNKSPKSEALFVERTVNFVAGVTNS